MTFGSLFSGIGGIDLGLERAGMTSRWQVEIDPYASRVLAKHWPNVKRFTDARTVELFEEESWRLIERAEPIDLLAGGFPCQDISTAGQGIGIIGARSGLWKEFARLVAELRPRFVFAENVPALRNRGLAMVLQDFWSLGYDAEWHCIPACALGTPHERDRIWIVAYIAGRFAQPIIWGDPGNSIRRDGGADWPEDASDSHSARFGNGESETGGQVWGEARRAESERRDCPTRPASDPESNGCRSRRTGGLGTGYSWQREPAFSNAHLDGERFGSGAAAQKQLRQASGREHSGRDASDLDREGLEIGICERGDAGAEQPAIERGSTESSDTYSEPLVRAAIARGERSAWTVEPGVVRDLYGFSSWLDGFGLIHESHNRIMSYGATSKERSSEALRFLRSAAASEAVQWAPGGFGSIPSAAVLLTYLWKLSQQSEESEHFQLPSEEVFEGALRSLWLGVELDGAPYRPEPEKQLGLQHPNALQALSRLLAHDAEKAWSRYRRENARHILTTWEYGWESGFRRMSHGTPNRVSRLRGLGNSVVPQVVEWIGRRIMEAHSAIQHPDRPSGDLVTAGLRGEG